VYDEVIRAAIGDGGLSSDHMVYSIRKMAVGFVYEKPHYRAKKGLNWKFVRGENLKLSAIANSTLFE
jgi:hypothetical protein